MRKNWRLAVLSALCAVWLGVAPARAAVISYTDSATWQAALTASPTTIPFTGIDGNYDNGTGLITAQGVTFRGILNTTLWDLKVGSPLNWSSGSVLYQLNAVSGLTGINAILAAGGVTAFASEVMAYDLLPHPDFPWIQIETPIAVSYSVQLFNGATSLGTYGGTTLATAGTHAFIGFTSSTPVTSAFFTIASGRLVADNFAFGIMTAEEEPPTEAPEAAVHWLTATGLLLVGWKSRRTWRFRDA